MTFLVRFEEDQVQGTEKVCAAEYSRQVIVIKKKKLVFEMKM